jgi:hypothetical protein
MHDTIKQIKLGYSYPFSFESFSFLASSLAKRQYSTVSTQKSLTELLVAPNSSFEKIQIKSTRITDLKKTRMMNIGEARIQM